ncbi:flagellar basal body P-ring formation chaperone FlgA [Paenalcaligenes faecalis]|uniref:flagellar basal body P-ring formation chaperone FlgA n=1 Tax=Paenalcaligenes faecalis TaxID=2980099 RepID=UPI0022B98C21|nr:flagellar basal body P-ring formation chaperone FlgA [Paenalcaligenes faecalis]
MIKSILLTLILSISSVVSAQTLQDPEQIVSEVEQFLLNQTSSYPGTASVYVTAPAIRNQIQCEHLQPFLPSGSRLRSRMSVAVRCQSPQAWTVHAQAELSIVGFYYISNRSIQVGEIISLDDMIPREGDLLRIAPNSITDPSLAIGYITTQRINTGSPIKSNALRDPQSIQRGQAVRTIARGVGFTATGEGQALQSGAPGAQIQVRASSGQIITGTVLDNQTVQILM